MIDRSKWLCYIITVTYTAKKDGKDNIHCFNSFKFISMYSMNSEKAWRFAKQLAKQRPDYANSEDMLLSHERVPNDHYLNAEGI